jgi:hypothetical protein
VGKAKAKRIKDEKKKVKERESWSTSFLPLSTIKEKAKKEANLFSLFHLLLLA